MSVRQVPLTLACLALLAVGLAQADDWPQFRGPRRDNISRETGLLRQWPADGPRVLWSRDVGQGYAGAAIVAGRAYFHDYDEQSGTWFVRCVKLADGAEIWSFAEERRIRPNHGITRTVPAVDDKYVFSMDPKCILHCFDVQTGRELWQKNLVRDYGAVNPPWYNAQCPLLEPDRIIIAVGGPEVLLAALEKATGNEVWRTPNAEKWPLSHSSVMPAELGGVKQYLWCTLFGPLGVRAADGRLLWHHARKFNVAVAPSPLVIAPDRVFMTSCYDAGTIMLRVTESAEAWRTEVVFDRDGTEWNSEVHTPIVFENHLFAVGKKKRGLFTCLDLDGKIVWDSGGRATFGLGPFLLVDGLFFVLEDSTGILRLLEANTTEYRELASAKVLPGHEAWAPIALSDGKMILRDLTKMVCIEVGPSAATAP